MFPRWTRLTSLALFVFLLSTLAAIHPAVPANAQDETDRAIIADDFLNRRKPRTGRRIKKPQTTYRLATRANTKRSNQQKVQVGVTIWKLEPGGSSSAQRSAAGSYWDRADWTPRRVEADVKFHEGDTLRISVESPTDGYLYVVNRDWLADGSYGETNLIFPKKGEDNRLVAGKLIDIPAQHRPPFKASPKPNQSSELLTILVTTSPLQLPLSTNPLPISKQQLKEWEDRWGGEADRLEMNGGAGKVRTEAEQLAASATRSRQLTREDPMPQTIFSVTPKNPGGLLFNLVLFYAR